MEEVCSLLLLWREQTLALPARAPRQGLVEPCEGLVELCGVPARLNLRRGGSSSPDLGEGSAGQQPGPGAGTLAFMGQLLVRTTGVLDLVPWCPVTGQGTMGTN